MRVLLMDAQEQAKALILAARAAAASHAEAIRTAPELTRELTEAALRWREALEARWGRDFARNYQLT